MGNDHVSIACALRNPVRNISRAVDAILLSIDDEKAQSPESHNGVMRGRPIFLLEKSR